MGLQNHGGASSAGATAGQVPHADGLGQFAWADPTTWNPESHPWNVKIDRVTTNGASMSSTVNPTQLTVSGITFTGADVGKMIRVDGAGAAGASLKTTITGSASGKAILASPCLTDVSNVRVMYGTDNATALDTLFRALEDFSAAGKPRSVEFRDGVAMHTSTLVFPLRGTIKTSQENWTNYDFQYGPNVHAERKGGFVFYQAWDQNVDCARVQSDDAGTLHQWFGKLSGFTIEQDIENTAGIGLNFTDPQDNPVLVIDGGQLEHIAVMGTAQSGINFADGIVTGVLIQPYVFATGWYDRALFTADTHGTDTLTNVSSFTGLAVGREVWGTGFPLGAMIKAIDSGAGTIQLTSAVTGTAAGVAVEQYGKGGILYQSRGSGQVTFLGASGDQNSGGLIRFIGAGGGAVNTESVVLIGTKNEFGANVYRGGDDSLWATTGSSPQGASAIVYDNAQGMKISVVGLYHHADASSATDSSTPNTKGRKIGPAQLVAPTGPPPGCVSWESLAFHFASAVNPPSSDQIALYDGNTGQAILHFIRGKGEYNSGSFSAEMSYAGGSHRLHSFGASGLFQGPGAGYGESVGWQIAGSTPVISWYNGAAPTGKQLIGWFLANDGSYRLRGLQSAANSYVTDRDFIIITRDAPGGGVAYLRRNVQVADTDYTFAQGDAEAAWSGLTAARVGNLPAIASAPRGTKFTLIDASGSASASLTLTAVPNGAETIVGATQITAPYGRLEVESDGLKWVGTALTSAQQVAQKFIASGTFVAPVAGTYRIAAIGAGGGGGGGGAAALTGGTATQVGGAGGGAGEAVEEIVTLTAGQQLTVTIGAGGSGGSGGAASSGATGNAGGAASVGANTTVVNATGAAISVTAKGGSQGSSGGANTATSANPGVYGGGPSGASVTQSTLPGGGGASSSAAGQIAGQRIGMAGRGGGGGGPANATNGGSAGTGSFISSKTGTAAGGSAANATANTGAGGDGGGAGAPGGAGGAGGNGGSGMAVITRVA
jgi:hypothetical protein